MKSSPRLSWMLRMLVVGVGLGMLASACAGGQGAPSSPDATTLQPSEGTYGVPEGGQRTGTVPTAPPSGQSFSLQARTGDDNGIDFAAYDESMNAALGAINEYWALTMPGEFGDEWVEPDEFIAYYPPEDNGPECGGEQIGPDNAVYCLHGDSDFIAWDEPGLMLPFYAEMGDMADAVILAHEFGHGAQARLGLSEAFSLTIESELQADCFAGAWAGWADEEGLLALDAADQAIAAVVSIADPEGVPWNDPSAHGTADERLEAFSYGVDGGATACVEDLAPGFSEEA